MITQDWEKFLRRLCEEGWLSLDLGPLRSSSFPFLPVGNVRAWWLGTGSPLGWSYMLRMTEQKDRPFITDSCGSLHTSASWPTSVLFHMRKINSEVDCITAQNICCPSLHENYTSLLPSSEACHRIVLAKAVKWHGPLLNIQFSRVMFPTLSFPPPIRPAIFHTGGDSFILSPQLK